MNRLIELRVVLSLTTPDVLLGSRRRYDRASNDVDAGFKFVRQKLTLDCPELRLQDISALILNSIPQYMLSTQCNE